jgi:GNAT superfamily N-acetyltransferase
MVLVILGPVDVTPAAVADFDALIDLALARCPSLERPAVAIPLEDAAFADWKVVLKAVDGDRLLGWGMVARTVVFPADVRSVRIYVAAAHERRGVGSALRTSLFDALDVCGDLRSGTSDDDPRSLEVARHWGFGVLQHSITSRLDLSGVSPVELPPGVTAESCPDLTFPDADRVEAMLEASQTNPERAFMQMTLPWLIGMLGTTETGIGSLLRVDGIPAAISFGGVVGSEAHLGYTGVDPMYRGRGFGALVKQHVHTLAIEAGVTACFTDNEEGNLGIRHVNESLGYRKDSGRYWLRRTTD